MNRSSLFAITLATSLAAAAPASALNPIDDMEIGFFSLLTSPNNTCAFDTLILNGYEPHCISQVRTVALCGFGDLSCAAYLDVGSQLDDMIRFFPGGNDEDFLRLKYDWGFPRTLTYGGVLNRIEVDLRGGVPSGRIALVIADPGGTDYVVRDAESPGILTFPLSEFTGVDVNMATWIQVDVASNGVEGAFQIADIRLRGDGYWGPAQTVNFVGDFVATEVPPVPSPPLSWRMTDSEGNWLYRTDMTITRADDGGVIDPCFHLDWSEAAGLGGEFAGIEFMGIQPEPFMDTNFELTVDLFTAIRLGPIPQIVGEPALTSSPFGFLATFPVLLTDVDGSELGRSETRILFDVPEEQLIELRDVQITLGGSSKHLSTNGFVLSFILHTMGDIDPDVPMLEAMWIADWSPQIVTGLDAPDVPGAPVSTPHGALVLTAWPNVTRDGAEIRASIPFAADGRVQIHDVSGRLVRVLAAPHGASSVRWDGRDARGESTASGVFFARLEGEGASARPARILRLH
jgi:hypothetical protein